MEDQRKVRATHSAPPGNEEVENARSFAPAVGAVDQRLKRIAEYLDLSLDKQDALQANLGAANADLLMIGGRLAAAIGQTMGQAPGGLEEFEGVMSAIDNLLRIHRQVDRFTQLDIRLTKMKEAIAAIEP